VNADAQLDLLIVGNAGVALAHAVLHLDGAAHGVDDAAEYDDVAVTGALDDAAVMHGDRRADQVAAERPEPGEHAILVGAGKPRIADNVGNQDRRQVPGLALGAPLRHPG
jgi:hypothetical protein